jgi:hypothetical protein
MDKKKSLILGLFAITLMSVGAITLANAYMNKSVENNQNNANVERHTLMEKAFETNDYNLWKSQMNGKGATNVINESNFAKFAEAHRLTNDGKYAEANKIRQELGLNAKNGEGGCGCDSDSCNGDGGCMTNGQGAGGCGMHKNQ